MISSEALGKDGREVRCSKCSHMWFQPPETDSLDELPETPPVEDEIPVKAWKDPFADEIAFTPHKDKPAAAVPDELKPKPSVKPDIQVDLMDRQGKKPLVSRQQQKQIAAVLAALAVTSVLFLVFITIRNPVGKTIPFFGAAYEKMGFTLAKETPKIAFDRVKLTFEGDNISGNGSVINLTSEKMALDTIKVDLLDAKNKVLKTTDIDIKDKALEAESAMKIAFTIADAPKEAVSVRLHVKD